jgi:hypothetical protein
MLQLSEAEQHTLNEVTGGLDRGRPLLPRQDAALIDPGGWVPPKAAHVHHLHGAHLYGGGSV